MKKVICDNCKSRQAKTISFETDRRRSPIGEFEWRFEYADLCYNCLIERIGLFLLDEQEDVKKRFINTITLKKEDVA
jgi:hypothetical protein